LLADWSIELVRYKHRKREARKKNKKGEKCFVDNNAQTDDPVCVLCTQLTNELKSHKKQAADHEREKKILGELLRIDEVNASEQSLTKLIEEKLTNLSDLEREVGRLKEEEVRMAESVGRLLAERDQLHSQNVRSLELGYTEKEKYLKQSANTAKQQLTAAKKELQQLQAQLESSGRSRIGGGTGGGQDNFDNEVESLRYVLDLKKEECDQLKASNNSLKLDLERLASLEIKLQVETQKAEERSEVIKVKNDQLRQVLDEYDSLQHQLEVEVSAHLACQQELEKSLWDKQRFLGVNNEKWIELKGPTSNGNSGLILDVVQKDKGLAYSFNC